MSLYNDLLRENSIIFTGFRRNCYEGIQFRDKQDIEFAATCNQQKNRYFHTKPSSALSSTISGSIEGKIQTHQISHPFSKITSEPKYTSSPSFMSPDVKLDLFDDSVNSPKEKKEIEYYDLPMSDSKFKLYYHASSSEFTRRISCYFSNKDNITVDCDVCCSKTKIQINQNGHTSCGHYVVCNECRGRDIRRILRCVECCQEMLGCFPVCSQFGNCVKNYKCDAFQSSICYRCGKRLRKETCNASCNRKQTTEYIQCRKDLKSRIMVLVRNPLLFNPSPLEFGTIRPCSHHSFCPIHHTVVKGHGKYIGCPQCKKDKKYQK